MPYANRLLAIDAFALLYRSFYAFVNRPLITPEGHNTSAVYGFMRTLLDCVHAEQPTHLVVAFDLAQPTFRHALYPEYKANREETPEPIIYGASVLRRLLPALGIPVVEVPSYEADDLLGTIAAALGSCDTKVFLFTPDKDYQQLLTDHVEMLKPSRSGAGVDRVTAQTVREKYGIAEPSQFRDILALWGDASDNVPGVPGVGEKTAAKLIAKYGSIERVLGNIARLTPKLSQAIDANAKQLAQARELVTSSTAAPRSRELGDYAPGAVDVATVQAIMAELHFNALGRDIEATFFGGHPERSAPREMGAFATIASTPHEYLAVVDDATFSALCDELEGADTIALDTETTGFTLHENRVVGVSFSTVPARAYYIPLARQGEVPDAWRARLQRILANGNVAIVGHNLKFDLLMLRDAGIVVKGRIYDTMVMHYLVNPDARHGLNDVAMELLNYSPVPYESLDPNVKPEQIDLYAVPLERLVDYAAEDADIALQLYHALKKIFDAQRLSGLYERTEGPLVSVLADMEWNGLSVDLAHFDALRQQFNAEIDALKGRVAQLAGTGDFNIDSPKQVGELLFDGLKVAEKPKRTKTGQYDTSEMELRKYAHRHPAIEAILAYREKKKLVSTYVDALPALVNSVTGRIHPHYNQTVTSTGRLSSSNPNIQNIPVRSAEGKSIRNAFVSRFPDGALVSADYSQIELRIMAHLSGDPNMVHDFQLGHDIHAATAARIFKVDMQDVTSLQRDYAKRANFGMIYGISAFGLSQQLGMAMGEAQRLIEDYFAMYPAVADYMRGSIEKAKKTGYAETLFGRRRWLPDIHSRNANLRGAAERNAINAPIQGAAADIMKIAMVAVLKMLTNARLGAKLIVQVHDELIVDAPAGEVEAVKSILQEGMRAAVQLRVPLVVDVAAAKRWGEI